MHAFVPNEQQLRSRYLNLVAEQLLYSQHQVSSQW